MSVAPMARASAPRARMPPEIDFDRQICTEPATASVQSLPAQGVPVVARGEHWRVERRVTHSDCAELHLANGAAGSVVLLWPFDRFVAVHRVPRVRAVRLRRWAARIAQHAAGPRAGRLRVAATHPRLLPYQLSPALAVAAGEARILLADEVGLGKTIQAGWIIADALSRDRNTHVLVAVPAGLRQQWQSELSLHFGIDASIADAAWLRRTAVDLPADVNPWSLPGVYLTSLDFIKRPEVARGFEYQLWDLLVVDEVHTAAAPTERHGALSALAHRSRCLVTISATPFSGDPQSFESIARLGATPDAPAPLMFRRSRENVGALGSRRHRFAAVRITRAENRLQRLMERYSHEVWSEASGSLADAARLAMTVLRKRALSSPRAALRSLERRLALLARDIPLPRQLDLFQEEDALDDEEPYEALSAPGLRDAGRERRWLALLIEAARRAADFDSKLRFLQRLLGRVHGDSAIVFTEYRDTLMHLAASFPGAALLHGGLAPRERDAVQRRFNLEGGLLLATDAASEGLNLQGRCRLVINYELPWNPARLEQRIGRVDRIGQRRRVHALTLVARDTAEDLVVAKLARRLYRIAAAWGANDRLASFLDEARTARIVIGNAGAEEVTDALPLTAVRRHAADDTVAAEEARRLSALRGMPSPAPWMRDVLVSTTTAHGPLHQGFLFVLGWTAATADGVIVDSAVFLIHVAESMDGRNRDAAAARLLVETALARHAVAVGAAVSRSGAGQLSDTNRVHQRIVRRLEDRERALLSLRRDGSLFQPGLFDRRAVQHAGETAKASSDLAHEHAHRLDLLERSMVLHARCDVVGVLIVQRGRA